MDIDELRKRAATEPNPSLRECYASDLEKATAKLVRGKDLTPAQREDVKRQFVNRLTPQNRHQAFGAYVNEEPDPDSEAGVFATHGYPQGAESGSDDEWIDSHAFYIRRDGSIASRPGRAEPETLASKAVRARLHKDANAEFAKAQARRYPTTKKPGDPTYSAEWSGVTGAPVARGKTCPDCGGKLHREGDSFYCPSCDDYKTPKEGRG